MNDLNRFIANIYIVLLNVRDTLTFCTPAEQPERLFNARKEGISSALVENTALNKFLKDNKERGEEISKRIKEFIDEVYGDDSTILKLSNGIVRVDHTQHVKIYEYIVGLTETIRDIIGNYMNLSLKENMFDETMSKLLKADEALYRSAAYKFIMVDLEKCFVEFNKVMAENKGQPSPQSNFILQNEFSKYTSELRFIRGHCHLTDNKTLDLLDDTLELIEMLEGRRERRDERNFPELFKEIHERLDAYVAEAEANWKVAYQPVFEEMVELAKKQMAELNKEGANDDEGKA